jgi:uncharacterized protein DUF4031
MAVYVDDMQAPFQSVPWHRPMVMCHMIADSHEELVEMADRIGVQQKWIQKVGTTHEHFDICLSKRKLAVRAGAVEISWRELVEKLKARE